MRGTAADSPIATERDRTADDAGTPASFRAKRADRVKILYWDGTGLCLFHKRLEKGRFVWPPMHDGTIRLSAGQLGLLLEGLDWSRVRPKPVIAPLSAA